MEGHECDVIDLAMTGRKSRRTALYEPVARKCRNDPSGDNRDQNDDRREPEPPSQTRGHGETCELQIHQKVGDAENGNGNGHGHIAPVAAGDDLAGNDPAKHKWKSQIDCRSQPERERC